MENNTLCCFLTLSRRFATYKERLFGEALDLSVTFGATSRCGSGLPLGAKQAIIPLVILTICVISSLGNIPQAVCAFRLWRYQRHSLPKCRFATLDSDFRLRLYFLPLGMTDQCGHF